MKDDRYPTPDGNTIWLKQRCCHCAERWQMRVDADRWNAYRHNHSLVQEAFPELGGDEREFLIGAKNRLYLCPNCWEKTCDLDGDDEPQEEDSPQEAVADEPPQRKVTADD